MPSLVFSVIVLGTQVIALFLSVYGVGQSQNISGIGWPRGLIIIAISLAIFLIIDLVKVLTIFIWEKIEKNPSTTSTFATSKKKPTTKAAAFVQRSRFGYDRAMRRESDSSIKSY